MTFRAGGAAVALLLVLGVGCLLRPPTVSVDPAATFAAHREHGGLAVDRLEHGRTGRLEQPSWFRRRGEPSFVLDSDGQTLAALWLAGSDVTVRSATAKTAPTIGRVRPDWQDGAIRLSLEPQDGEAFRTDILRREHTGLGPMELTRAGQTVLDVRGVYEAPVRDRRGVAVGWLRTRVSPYQEAARIYEAALPAAVPPALAAATAVALDAEIDWIENHSLNVYRGNSSGAPLGQSVPFGR
jgi:hypothetical protein